jgi:ubiquinone/menaquinone biosynthesis C-methylase UbiE
MTEPDPPASDASADANAVYALGSNEAETNRLRRQAQELAADSASALERVRLGPGQRAVDVGCGPRGVLDLMAGRVAPGGVVVGVDADPNHVAAARQFVAEQRLKGVEVIQADARATGLATGSFDVLHCRTVLVTLPDPVEVLAEMVRVARPGGSVTALEPDTEYSICYPQNRAFDRLSELFLAAFSRNGADPNVGRKLPEMFRRVGLSNIELEVRPQLIPAGHSRRTVRLDLVRSMQTAIVELGLATAVELDDLDRSAREHLSNPDTIVMYGCHFLVWGRKPA